MNKQMIQVFALAAILSTPTSFGIIVAAPPPSIAIGLSPNYPPSEIPRIREAVTRFILQAPAGTAIFIGDAQDLRTIAAFEVPHLNYDNPGNRARSLAQPLSSILQWCNAHTNISSTGEPPALSSLRTPEFLDQVAGLTAPGHLRSILLIGSPIYRSEREGAFSMTDARVPSDGHLKVGRVESPYGTLERKGHLAGATVTWCYLSENSWDNPLQRTLVGRFWNLYSAQLGARIAYFGPDLALGFGSVANPPPTSETFKVNDDDSKLEMRVARPRQIPTWLPPLVTETNIVSRSSQHVTITYVESGSPESTVIQNSRILSPLIPGGGGSGSSTGPRIRITDSTEDNLNAIQAHSFTKAPVGATLDTSHPISSSVDLGIMWESKDSSLDLDLYVRPERGAKELYFMNVRTTAGEYLHDWTQPNAATDFEWVRLNPPVDLNQVEAWVNLFNGQGPITGRVALHFENKVYTGTFHIDAAHGNGGENAQRRETSPNWTRINLKALVGETRENGNF